MFGLMRILLLMVIRPIVTFVCWKVLRNNGFISERARLTFAIVLFIIFCAPALRKFIFEKIIKTIGITRRLLAKVKVGVHTQGVESTGGKVAAEAKLDVGLYTSPFLNGDWTTVIPSLFYMFKTRAPVDQHRKLFNSRVD